MEDAEGDDKPLLIARLAEPDTIEVAPDDGIMEGGREAELEGTGDLAG